MIYVENFKGGVRVRGNALGKRLHFYETKFADGDVVYVKDKAKKGILEKIVIKELSVKTARGYHIAIYKDTFNALWNEWDLVKYREAIQLSIEFYEKQLIDIQYVEEDLV